jgi:hypothetical protein
VDYDVELGDLIGKIVHIETSFLYGNLKDTMYIEIHKGIDAKEYEYLVLNEAFHALV